MSRVYLPKLLLIMPDFTPEKHEEGMKLALISTYMILPWQAYTSRGSYVYLDMYVYYTGRPRCFLPCCRKGHKRCQFVTALLSNGHTAYRL